MITINAQGLDRFVLAQERDFEIALTEISYGKNKHTGCGTYSPKSRDSVFQIQPNTTT
jgi:hypothetical protein